MAKEERKKRKRLKREATAKPGVDDQPGFHPEKFSQSIGIENYNKTDEPVITPPNEIQEEPPAKP